MFSIVDVLLIVLVVSFGVYGLAQGFVKAVGSLVGFLLGFFLAGWTIVLLNDALNLQSKPILAIIIFFVLMTLSSGLMGWIVGMIDALRKAISFIPFMKSINSLLGGVFGTIEGILSIAAIAYFATYLPEGGIRTAIAGSQIVSWLSWLTNILVKFVPTISV